MSPQQSADGRFLRNLVRFLVGLVALFVGLGIGVYYWQAGLDGMWYLAVFFVVAFGIPVGVLLVFAGRRGGSGGSRGSGGA